MTRADSNFADRRRPTKDPITLPDDAGRAPVHSRQMIEQQPPGDPLTDAELLAQLKAIADKIRELPPQHQAVFRQQMLDGAIDAAIQQLEKARR
jgi:DNA-directed RNA polymerase specialized sigma24 family protein